MTIKYKRGRRVLAKIGDLRTCGAVPDVGEHVKLDGEPEAEVKRRRWVQSRDDWVVEVQLG